LKFRLFIGVLIFSFLSCGDEGELPMQEDLDHQSILKRFEEGFEQLPEKAISISSDSNSYAQYAKPTDIYAHAILGDAIEAQQLVFYVSGQFYNFILSNEYVFEDIRPRLIDVDDDNQLELVTIRTNLSEGAGIVIYKLINGAIEEYAVVGEIGSPNKWLNIVAVEDLDNDGIKEIVWIETPHIGGILKVAKIKEGVLEVFSEQSQFSNHAIGERNLCLSVTVEKDSEKIVYVPSQDRSSIVGFSLNNQVLSPVDTIIQAVDFSLTLSSQYDFENIVQDEVNCIF